MSSLSELLKLQSTYLEIMSPAVREIIEANKKIKSAFAAYDVFEPYLANLRLLQTHIDSALKVETLNRTIKESFLAWDLISFNPVFSETFFAKYSTTFSQLGLNYGKDFFQWHKEMDLVEVEYELLDESAVEDEQSTKTVEDKQAIFLHESRRIQKIILDIYQNNSHLLQLQPREFEEVIAELLITQGFEVQLTKQTRDGGFDIMAILNLDSHAPQKWLVECKRYSEIKVDVDIVRSFKEVVQSQHANRGIIATTSYFTRDAKIKREETPYLLDFRDKDAVMGWIVDYGNSTSNVFN